jgi:hypothetical protein
MLGRICISLLMMCSAVSAHAAKPLPLPLPLGNRMPVEIVLTQQELAIDVPDTSAMGSQFGLIGALISSSMDNAAAKKAEERIGSLRNALIAYPFNDRLEAAFRLKLASEGISSDPQISVMKTAWDAIDAQAKGQMPAYAMVITPRYAMDNAFSRMYVSLSVSVVDRTVGKKGKVKIKARTYRNYAFEFPIETGKPEQNMAVWQSIPSPALEAMLDEGIQQVADMLVYDFSAQGRNDWSLKTKKATSKLGGRSFAGLQLRDGDGWIWVRNGVCACPYFINSIGGYRLVDPAALAAEAQTQKNATPAHEVPAAPASADAPALPTADAAHQGGGR